MDNQDYKSIAKVDARRNLHGNAVIVTRNKFFATQGFTAMTALRSTARTSTFLIHAK